jgi:NDP-sugar pyrophosphorylase family protein
MNIVIPMAGPDKLFQDAGYPFTKFVTEIDGRPLIEHSFDCLRAIGDARFIFVIRKEHDLRFHIRDMLSLLDPDAAVVSADGDTAGAACSVMLAVEYIDSDEELIIANGDQILEFDVAGAIESFRRDGLDAGTVVFDSVHPRWSFVKTDGDGRIVEAAEKRPISRNATAGFYYFRRGHDFIVAAQEMIRKGASVGGGYFVCPSFNELILRQKKLGVVRIERDQYVSLATPQAVEEYEQVLLARKRSKMG